MRLRALGDPGQEACDLGGIRLLSDERVEDEVVVGAPQDTQITRIQPPCCRANAGRGRGRAPLAEDGPFRTLTLGTDGTASGAARFEVDGLAAG